MSKSPGLISIIIPCYNRVDNTLLAIQSAEVQTYTETEIIVVNDGSTENISELTTLADLGAIHLLHHSKNKGANAARNTGLDAAKGEWIAFLDSDDLWHPEKLSIMMAELAQSTNFSVAYCGTNMCRNGEVVFTKEVSLSGNLYSALLAENIPGSASVPIIKKEVLEAINGFDEHLPSAQDWDLWLRIAEQGYLFLAIPQVLVDYTLPEKKGHISSSATAFWKGRKAFLRKHKSKYTGTNKKKRSTIYSDMGFLLLQRFGKRAIAFKCFILAILTNPRRVKSWRGLIGVFLPTFILKKTTHF